MVDKKTVEYIANLAKLEISEEEKAAFAGELGSILEYMQQLNDADTNGVDPTSVMAPGHDPLRDDVVKESLPRDRVLQNGPSVKKGFFAVPKVIEAA